jgi:hypothetical protein
MNPKIQKYRREMQEAQVKVALGQIRAVVEDPEGLAGFAVTVAEDDRLRSWTKKLGAMCVLRRKINGN